MGKSGNFLGGLIENDDTMTSTFQTRRLFFFLLFFFELTEGQSQNKLGGWFQVINHFA